MNADPVGETKVRIRPAIADDLPAIAAIEKGSFSDPWSISSFTYLLSEALTRVSVAAQGKDVVGYAVATYVADEGELANIAVRPDARGRGIGSILLHDVIAEGWRRGAKNIYLEVRARNEDARAMYRRAGFREIGRRERYYSRPVDDAIMMVKERQA